MMDWWQATFPDGRKTLIIRDRSGRDVAIAYGETGAGQPLFLLHGIGSWSYSWRFTIPVLAQRFRVFCIDAKGYGFSQASFHPETAGHQIDEFAQILQQLVSEPAIVVGESLGALTALTVAQHHPEWIRQLVLINAPVFPQRLPSFYMRWLANLPLGAVREIDRLRLARLIAPIIRHVARFIRREVVVDPSRITPEEIYWLTYPYLSSPGKITQFATDLRHAAQDIADLLHDRPSLLAEIQKRLPEVTCPALILWGDCDRWFPVTDGETLHSHLANSQFQILPNCGHNISGGNVAAANAAILDFLEATARRDGDQIMA